MLQMDGCSNGVSGNLHHAVIGMAAGIGTPDEPIASDDTDEGRQKNRRVQFKIIERNKP